MTLLGLAELFKRPVPTRPDLAVTLFDDLLILVFNLRYTNLGLMYLLFFKLCAFLQRSNFSNFHQFFYHNFRLKLFF